MQTIIGLPVADVTRSKEFFVAIGFSVNPYIDEESMASVVLNEDSMLMLYSEPTFTGYTGVEIPDLSKSREVMNGFAAESREQVDEVVNKALAAGAQSLGDPQDLDGMYMRGFRDLDGHWWSLNYIDFAAMSSG